jgi:hypothetical protein
VKLQHRNQFPVSIANFQVQPSGGAKVRTWARALLAVLLGNLAYFSLLPKLPLYAQHAPRQLDFGLLLDFGMCAAIFVILNWRWHRQDR